MLGTRVRGGGAVTCVIALTAGAWFAGSRIKSPSEAAATANPPNPSRITAPVERRVLESTVITRGTVRYGDPRDVVLASSSLKAGATAIPAAMIVSTPAVKGATLAEGDRALEVGGRPVLVLRGTNPAYRDLRPGDEGPDVQQLEDALARLGFDPGSRDGRYDATTERAVEAWYRKRGYEPFGPTESQRSALNAARDTLARAEDGVIGAQRTVEQSRALRSPDKVAAATERVRQAQAKAAMAVADAERSEKASRALVETKTALVDLAQTQVTADETAITRFQRDAAFATTVSDATTALADAEASLREAEANRDDAVATAANAAAAIPDAQASLDAARADLDRAKKTRPTIPSENGGYFVTDNADGIRTTEGIVRSAEASLRNALAANESAKRAVTARELAIDTATRQVSRARTALDRARSTANDEPPTLLDLQQKAKTSAAELTRLQRELQQANDDASARREEADESLRSANAAVRVAVAELAQLTAPTDTDLARAQVLTARQTRERAQRELTSLDTRSGISVPANEVLFFDEMPVRVDEVKALRGTAVTGPVMTVTTSTLAVDSSVDTSDARMLKVGARVTIESNEFNVTLPGVISELATTPGTKGVDPTEVYFAVTPDGSSGVNANSLNGASVKLTIPVQSTGTEVLTVPESAVSVGPDGRDRVEIEERPESPTRFVVIRTGISAEGYVAITPVEGVIKVGTNVVTGDASPARIEGEPGPEDAPSDTTAAAVTP